MSSAGLRVLISGSTGLVGQALFHSLKKNGHTPLRLMRANTMRTFFINEQKKTSSLWTRFLGRVYTKPFWHVEESQLQNVYTWGPEARNIDQKALEKANIDVVVHLAGENIGSYWWTKDKKKAIVESRDKGTKLLAETMAKMENPPKVFLSASGVGWYGDFCGDKVLTEEDGKCIPPRAQTNGLLASLASLWEEGAYAGVKMLKEEEAKRRGITIPRGTKKTVEKVLEEAGVDVPLPYRIVNMRFGVVMSKKGGALRKMLPAFWLGLGGRVGRGDQYMSWIAIDDLVRAIEFLMKNEKVQGVVNVTSPNPVTSSQFAKSLGWALCRPAILPLPSAAVSFFLGEMGKETLLNSLRVHPKKLEEAGFEFKFGELDVALKHVLK